MARKQIKPVCPQTECPRNCDLSAIYTCRKTIQDPIIQLP